MDSCFERIKYHYPNLSRQQKKIADEIIGNYKQVAFFSAKQLAQQVNSSDSTVIRLAYKLGYEGYPELVKDLQKIICEEQIPWRKLCGSSNSGKDKSQEILTTVLELDIQNIKTLMKEELISEFGRATDIIKKAEHLYIFASRSTYSLAHYAGYLFRYVVNNVDFFPSETGDAYEKLEKINSSDAVIAIAYPRYTRSTINLASFVHEKGAKVISITDSVTSPLIPCSDVTLLSPNSAPFYSIAPGFSLINALIVALGVDREDSTLEQIEMRNNIIRNNILVERNITY